MEEKEKNSNFSPRKNKVRDLIQKAKEPKEKEEKNQKEKNDTKKERSLTTEKSYKFEITYKNKELNKFKDEILSYLRNRDYYYIEKLKNLKSQTDITDKNLDNLSDVTQKNFNNILSTQAEITTKLDKLKTYDAFVNKANDKLISHEIRINCLREDLTKTIQKYDKIYLENLEVPGYIGRCSKYANCKIFFTEVIKEMDKFNTYREKNIIDLCTYKERLENIIKMFQNLVDNNNDSQIKYITKLNDKTNKNLLEAIEEKISNVRVDNSKFASDLISKANELNELYNNINSIKDYILKEFNNKSEEFYKKTEETNKSFEEYKIEYSIIRKKFLELADFIKNGKFSRHFGSLFGKKEINAINKKLVKDTKEIIDSKDVKLLDNIEDVEKMEFKQKNNNDNKTNNNNNNNNNGSNMNRISKSQNNFDLNNNIGKRKNYGFTQNTIINGDKNRNSFSTNNNQIKVHQGVLFYLGDNTSTKNNLQKIHNINKNNLINEKDKNIKNSIIPIEKPKIPAQNINNENKEKNSNNDLVDIKILKVQKEERKNTFCDELSMSESFISNINNSINTFSTTNDKNNSLNSLININNNNNKCNKFNLFEEDLHHNNKIIKELASELEQSTAKVNKLASNKKEIEENFKSICNKIQPINLKLNNLPLEQIPEQKIKPEKEKEKDKDNNITNKSEQNTTIISHNINTNNTNTNNNNENINIANKARNNKFKEYVESKDKEKVEENNTTLKSNKSKNRNKHNQHVANDTLLNDTINSSIDKKMNIYDKKIGDLECFTREQIIEIIKQINIIKKTYSYIANIIKRDKSGNSSKLNGHNNTHNNNNIFDQSHGSCNSFNNNYTNNENKNNLNLTGTNFYKKSLKNEINSKYGTNGKIIQTMDDINFSDNLFYNGKYYFNIKDIFDKNKNNLNFNIENRKLLKQIDNKFLEENIGRNRNNSSNNKNANFKNNNSLNEGTNDSKWIDLKKLGKSKNNKMQKPQSGINPSSLLSSLEK